MAVSYTHLIEMEGFGEKSFHNLADAIERAKKVTLPKFLYSLGIANVGLSNAKLICRYFEDDLDAIRNAEAEDFTAIDGIGPIIGEAVSGYFRLENNKQTVDRPVSYTHLIGHLLGSASIEVWLTEADTQKKIVFSGDIGNNNQPLIKDPHYTESADYVVMESTYGDRFHESQDVYKRQFLS